MKTAPRRSIFPTAEERERERQNKRTAVLETAASMFCARGYVATQMGDIAAELGVTKPTIYHYFKNKDDILAACFDEGLALLGLNISEDATSTRSKAERLKTVLIDYAICMTKDFGKCTALVPVSDLDEPGRSRIRERMRSFDSRIRSLITEAVADGSIPPCDPKVATFTVLGSLNSIAKWHKPSGPLSSEELARAVVEQLFCGIGWKDGQRR